MPLADRQDYEDARYTGLAVISDEPLAGHLHDVSVAAGFDFLAIPLASSIEPRLDAHSNTSCDRAAFARQDMISLNGDRPAARLLGLVSDWIDPDSEDPQLRKASQAAFRSEVEWAKFLGLQAIAVPPPHSTLRPAGYAQVINSLLEECSTTGVWVRLVMSKDTAMTASTWRWWDTVRTLCGYKSNLGILLEIRGSDDMTPESFENRWMGEPVRGVLVSTEAFLRNKRQFPVLPRPLQAVVQHVYKLGQQVTLLVSQPLAHLTPLATSVPSSPTPAESAMSPSSSSNHSNSTTPPTSLFAPTSVTDVLRAHFDYLAFLFQKLPPLTGLSAAGFAFRDHLQLPLQPLADNLDSSVYETFEKDKPKYTQYREALKQALHDMHYTSTKVTPRLGEGGAWGRRSLDGGSEGVLGGSRNPVLIAVLGAGRGPLIDAALRAADSEDVKVKVVAVEKNPCAVTVLRWRLANDAIWHGRVTLTAADMRTLGTTMQADIVVSELLGSFGDNELSPECLEGVGSLLRPGGISIPASYTSYLAPACTHAVHASIKNMGKAERFETGMVVRLWKHVVLAQPAPVFTFEHPEREPCERNREQTLTFTLDPEKLPSTMHGFAAYFEAVLYKDVTLSIVPRTHTPKMQSWFPMFFPLGTPVRLEPGSRVAMSIWRLSSPSQVWYEWALLAPMPSKVHNAGGHAYAIKLAAG